LFIAIILTVILILLVLVIGIVPIVVGGYSGRSSIVWTTIDLDWTGLDWTGLDWTSGMDYRNGLQEWMVKNMRI